MNDVPALEVLGQVPWEVHWGGINNTKHGGLGGKLTKCRARGVVFYVRENLKIDHFHVSAGERQSFKNGRVSKRFPQVLELLAPPERWDELADLVGQADTLHRPVRKNRNFTWAWAQSQFQPKEDQ